MQISRKVSKLENTIVQLDQKVAKSDRKIDAATTMASKIEGGIKDI